MIVVLRYRLIIYPNDGLANFFFISFCVSRKNNAYGETGLSSKKNYSSHYKNNFRFSHFCGSLGSLRFFFVCFFFLTILLGTISF